MTLNAFGVSEYRRQLGIVLQDDALLAGTVADNISFFDPHIDMERVEACARRASVHDDIKRMPMGYLSLVGDMGTTLSGGQKQRVLIARALYRRPKILFLDEGTANIDQVMEKKVCQSISTLPVTKILIAHRPAMLSLANRIFVVQSGKVSEISREQVQSDANNTEAAE